MYHSSPFSFLSFPPNVVSFICFLLSFLPNLTFFYTPSLPCLFHSKCCVALVFSSSSFSSPFSSPSSPSSSLRLALQPWQQPILRNKTCCHKINILLEGWILFFQRGLETSMSRIKPFSRASHEKSTCVYAYPSSTKMLKGMTKEAMKYLSKNSMLRVRTSDYCLVIHLCSLKPQSSF